MFWRMSGLSTTSPVDSLLDKDSFTLQDLLDEDELMQECKSLNPRLINFLKGKSQIQQLVRYVIEEPLEGSDTKQVFKFPFIACEIITCEIEVILKNIVGDEQIMDLLFSFLDQDRSHGVLLAGYFSKVVICLLMRKTMAVMQYLQAHKEILTKLVDLISVTSIMEVLIRLVGADNPMHLFHEDSTHWLADTDLLEMLMDKLSPLNSSEANANAADTLSVVSRLSQSELATKLSSPSVIARLFHHALDEQDSQSTLVHCLSVCISILEPKRYVLVGTARLQQIPDSQVTASLETINAMLLRLGDLSKLLEIRAEEKALPTTYGELHPPLGPHRLKIVEFLAVLVLANNEAARQKLVSLGAIRQVLNLFFDYPFHNLLHHHVERIVASCIESNEKLLIDHLLVDCDMVERLLQVDRNPYLTRSIHQPTLSASHKATPRVGNLGHLTRIANRLLSNSDIQAYLQENFEWMKWQSEVLQSRNSIENVCGWSCGRPSTTRDQPVDSDDDDFREKDYDISTMASNLTREVFRYRFDNDDGDEEIGLGERDCDDVFFDDESAKVVISSLRFGEEEDSYRPKENHAVVPWLSFSDDQVSNPEGLLPLSTSSSNFKEGLVDVCHSEAANSTSETLVDEECHFDAAASHVPNTQDASATMARLGGISNGADDVNELSSRMENLGVLNNAPHPQGKMTSLEDEFFCARPPDRESWENLPPAESTTGRLESDDSSPCNHDIEGQSKVATTEVSVETDSEQATERWKGADIAEGHEGTREDSDSDDGRHDQVCDLVFDKNVKFVGVEIEGMARAMEHALREGIVGEAAPIHLPILNNTSEVKTNSETTADLEYNDVNYWKNDYNRLISEKDFL